jgi:papain fold toxin 1 (glutamine deamidase) of polymorphic toxin system
MLPDELEWVLDMLGFHWPTADEDKLVQCAEVWESFAENADRLHADANRSTSTVLAHHTGEAADAFRDAYRKFDGDDGYLRNAAQTARTLGVALRAAAVVVQACKYAVIAQLVALAVELIAAQAAAPFTLGLSELGSTGATTATRMIVRRLLDELRKALAEAILDCLKEPAVSAVESMVSDLVRQTVDVDFGAQRGYDLGATAGAGAQGAWAAARQTPQTFLESLRDSAGSAAGGAARGRLDGYLDANSPFRDGAAGTGGAVDTDGDGIADTPSKDDFSLFSPDAPGPGLDLGTEDGPGPATVLDPAAAPDGTADGLPLSVTKSAADAGLGSPGGDYPLPTPHADSPSLSDFDDPAPHAPAAGAPAHHGGMPAPPAHSAPVRSPTPSHGPDHGGPSIRTQIDSLASNTPAHTAPSHAPHVPAPSPAGPPRGDGGGPVPTAPPPSPVSTGDTDTGPSSGRTGAPSGPGPGPASPGAGRTASPAGPGPAGTSAAGPGAPASTPYQRTPSAPSPAAPAPHTGAPRTPVAGPGQPVGGPRSDPGPQETGAQQSHAAASRGQAVIPPPAVLVRPRRAAGGPPSGPDSPWGPAVGAGATPAGDGGDGNGLHDIRAALDHEPGGLGGVDPDDQQALDDAVPRNPDGTPERFPDPFGDWSRLQNDGGHEMPGRSNNSADCSRAFLATWRGDPQVSAPRTPDLDDHGNPDPWAPEEDANAHQVRWAGAPHTYAGPGGDPGTAARIEQDLLRAGHGSAAVVQVDWPDGGGHAFNAVNHHGTVVWVDSQCGEVSHEPLYVDQAEHVWHIPMDPHGRPLPAEQPESAGRAESAETPETAPKEAPADGPRLP